MVYKTKSGHVYNHTEFDFPYVTYPLEMTTQDHLHYSQEIILPLADWTLNYEDVRLRPSYWITVTASRGSITRSMTISDIDLTGNIHDLIFLQPEE